MSDFDYPYPDFVLTLLWTCQSCGWTCEVDAPGFAGDGRLHYMQPDNRTCGPITAQRVSRPASDAVSAAERRGM